MIEWTIQRLNRTHDRSQFDSGRATLDDWLKTKASQFDRRDMSRTFVATLPDDVVVRGYYAVSTHRVRHEDLPVAEAKKLPRLNVPVVLLGRLAVDRGCQGQGLGGLLLVDALRRALHISEEVGIRAVEVDAIDDEARRFYLKYGFQSLNDDPRHLWMTTHEIRRLKLDPFS